GQADTTMIWGHPDFRTTPRRDGIWVAHGHTVVDVPEIADGRIALDTGAHFSGLLTVGVLEEGTFRTLT
ncbi:MAG: serine/threonine protein phosphatase, partial [Jannaschia helgolandensis]